MPFATLMCITTSVPVGGFESGVRNQLEPVPACTHQPKKSNSN